MSASGEILIAGAGIGGLTLALALQQKGIACRVFESAPQMMKRPIGTVQAKSAVTVAVTVPSATTFGVNSASAI